MKKFTTKLLMSIIAVAFAFVALGTSTYAWFSMNTTVQATGMQITAKSDTEFLVIVAGETFNSTATSVTVTSTEEAELYPVTPAATLTAANVATPASWKYAYSGANDDYQKKADTEYITCTSLTDYVASETFSVGLNDKSGAQVATKDLKLTGLTVPANTGITVVVVCGNNIYQHNANVVDGTEVLAEAASVTQSGLQISVYYFIDGENSNVYSDNADALTGQVVLTFGLK